MNEPLIRMYGASDAEAVLALNQSNVPEVGSLTMARLEALAAEVFMLDVVEHDGALIGAIVVMEEGASYGSPNYRYFSDRFDSFAYVDRVMLAPEARGKGLGPRLYELVKQRAKAELKEAMCAEVNTEPANPRSIRFHEVFGFTEIERRRPYSPDEEVAMFELLLSGGTKPKRRMFKRS